MVRVDCSDCSWTSILFREHFCKVENASGNWSKEQWPNLVLRLVVVQLAVLEQQVAGWVWGVSGHQLWRLQFWSMAMETNYDAMSIVYSPSSCKCDGRLPAVIQGRPLSVFGSKWRTLISCQNFRGQHVVSARFFGGQAWELQYWSGPINYDRASFLSNNCFGPSLKETASIIASQKMWPRCNFDNCLAFWGVKIAMQWGCQGLWPYETILGWGQLWRNQLPSFWPNA